MLTSLPDFAAFIETHADWAEVIIVLMAFAEGLRLIGLLIPGVVMLNANGVLARPQQGGFRFRRLIENPSSAA
ncbi:hypothetical protein [Azospirillum melinis]